MVFDITHLKKIRKQLGLTQHEFAKKAGVSQSMVAKIEAGKLDPTYSYVLKIEQAIAFLTKHEEQEAQEIMTRNVITVAQPERVCDAIQLLMKHDISQIPVVEGSTVVGLITESDLLGIPSNEMMEKRVRDVMKESPPIISPHTKLSVILSLLKFYPIILVKDTGKLRGVITKADVLRVIAHK